ncbi:MAG TPA: hypothetical protein VF432_12340 [Thermoanaerobaculia bacterium]
MRAILLTLMCAWGMALRADQPMCGTSPATDRRVRAVHERTRARIAASALPDTRRALLREGAFYVPNDETITPGYRPFDLDGQTLVFTPAGNDAFTMRRVPLQYVEPSGAPVRDFADFGGAGWWYEAYDLPFALPLFGSSVTRVYVSALNGIHTAPPPQPLVAQFDALQAAVYRGPVLSPLMLTMTRPGIDYPRLWIEHRQGAVIVTWRSSRNAPFGYDVQARLGADGTISYSYRSLTAMRFGTPVLSPGLDPATVARTVLVSADDPENDLTRSVPEALKAMLDVRHVEVQRLAGSELFAARIVLAAPIDRTKLGDSDVLEYEVRLTSFRVAHVEIGRTSTRVRPFDGDGGVSESALVHVDGNVVELYGLQAGELRESVRLASYFEPQGRVDSVTVDAVFPAATRSLVTDLSAVAQDARLDVPIAEPFLLGELDPYRVWDVVESAYSLSAFDYDAMAIYQTFYTDLIFYAGAYSTVGNPQADGIAPFSPFYGTHWMKQPALLHMNQLTYGYGASEESAAQVLLHELGHRWLYHFSISENGFVERSLNPLGPHPAAYVHTAAAFPVYGEREASVMGGGYFAPRPDGSYAAHAANHGYSWTDLYLMGLADRDEVPPWFYLAGTYLGGAYWPPDGAVVTGERREVRIGQITAVHGPRRPSAAISPRQFRVLFVLVTESGAEPTEAEVAKLNQWRHVMERNFLLATGGRARLVTTFVRPGKRRAS